MEIIVQKIVVGRPIRFSLEIGVIVDRYITTGALNAFLIGVKYMGLKFIL